MQLEYSGYPGGAISDNTGMARMFDTDGRGRGGVPQPPEYERSLA